MIYDLSLTVWYICTKINYGGLFQTNPFMDASIHPFSDEMLMHYIQNTAICYTALWNA